MVYDSNGFIGSLGERIRFFRVRKRLTQKQLADLCHISEPAIRNYELNNRIPSYDTMNNIASALDVSYYLLADPDIGVFYGAAHALFKMEYAYRLRPFEVDGKAVLGVEYNPNEAETPLFQMLLEGWLQAHKKLESGEWTIDQYYEWIYKYPVVPGLSLFGQTLINEAADRVRETVKKHPRKNAKRKSEVKD